MAIRRKIPRLRLDSVDELIAVREQQHGGKPGAPKKVNGERVGAALNKSCILMLSALLQGYVEDVFVYASWRLFQKTLKEEDARRRYRSTFYRWGNPSSENIGRLFFRLGIENVFDGLTWARTQPKTIRDKLNEINELRNKIAHGHALPEAVSLNQVKKLRNFVEQFGERFGRHVRDKLPKGG
jgi:hypothetical protein